VKTVVRPSWQRAIHLHGPSSRILGEEACDRPKKQRTAHKPVKRASPLSERAHNTTKYDECLAASNRRNEADFEREAG